MEGSEKERRATLFAMESIKASRSVPIALNVASAVDDRINDCNAIKTHPMAPNTDACIFGCCSDDLIAGGKGSNTLRGGAGNDFLYGEGGNDTLDGGSGVNRLEGGAGNDTYIVQTADVSVATPQPGQPLLMSTVIKDSEGKNRIRLNTSRASVELAPGSDSVGLRWDAGQGSTAGIYFEDYASIGTFTLEFADGQTLALSRLVGDTLQASVRFDSDAAYGVPVGGKNNDSLRVDGNHSTLSGGKGDDQLVVDGGAGADQISGDNVSSVAGGYAGKHCALRKRHKRSRLLRDQSHVWAGKLLRTIPQTEGDRERQGRRLRPSQYARCLLLCNHSLQARGSAGDWLLIFRGFRWVS